MFCRNILYLKNYLILSVALTEMKKGREGGKVKRKRQQGRKEGKEETNERNHETDVFFSVLI